MREFKWNESEKVWVVKNVFEEKFSTETLIAIKEDLNRQLVEETTKFKQLESKIKEEKRIVRMNTKQFFMFLMQQHIKALSMDEKMLESITKNLNNINAMLKELDFLKEKNVETNNNKIRL